MKKTAITALLALLTICHISATGLRHYELRVSDFTELKVIEGLNVDYHTSADSAGLVVFDTTPELASVIMLSSGSGKLSLQLSTDGIEYHSLPTITVYSSRLDKVENSGDSLVRVYSPVCGDKFSAKVVGNGTLAVHDVNTTQVNASLLTGHGQLTIFGTCVKASLKLTGTGTVQADGLRATEASCKIFGTGTIGCHATDKVSLFGAGTGTLYYTGNPATVTSRGLGLHLVDMNE